MTVARPAIASRQPVAVLTAAVLLLGAVSHLAIPLLGPQAYAWFGAPAGLVAMAEAGAVRPWLSCIVIAIVLLVLAAYVRPATGRAPRLPLRRPVLHLAGAVLLLRGLAFVPLAAWRPQALAGICGRCDGVTGFVLATSALCLLLGLGILHAARPLDRTGSASR